MATGAATAGAARPLPGRPRCSGLQYVPIVVYADHPFLWLEGRRLVPFVLFGMMALYRIGLILKRTAAMTFRQPAAAGTEQRVEWIPAQHRGEQEIAGRYASVKLPADGGNLDHGDDDRR